MILTIYMFFLHFLADFILQSREMGKNKSNNFNYLVGHVLIQVVVFFVGLSFLLSYPKAYQIACLNGFIHGIIDWYIWRGYKWTVKRKLDKHYEDDQVAKAYAAANWEYWNDKTFYTFIGLDQMLHFTTIVLVIWFTL